MNILKYLYSRVSNFLHAQKAKVHLLYNYSIFLNIVCNTHLLGINVSVILYSKNSNLNPYLIKYFDIVGYRYASTKNNTSLVVIEYLKYKSFKLVVQDVCEEIKIKENIDYIFHAASQASPKYYGIDPVGTLTPNGLSVAFLHFWICSRKTSGYIEPAPINPKPPALLTALANL